MTEQNFSDKIINWHQKSGRHNLPWQKNKTPYRVFISEIMLQQTQVTTVIPYYKRFMRTLPSVKSLALSPRDQVYQLFAGLGFYARAKRMHQSAKIVYQEHNSRFPKTLQGLTQLPGIGESTAGAILSLGHNQYGVILDGNVKRVLSRAFTLPPFYRAAERKIYWQKAKQLTPRDNHATYNQAMMDLGSMVCTKSKPNCDLCPIQSDCLAHATQNQELYPQKKITTTKNRKTIKLPLIMYLTPDKKQILLEKRIESGIWGGLHCLPESQPQAIKKNNLSKLPNMDFTTILHRLTHLDLMIEPACFVLDQAVKLTAPFSWQRLDQIEKRLGLPGPVQKIILNCQHKLRSTV